MKKIKLFLLGAAALFGVTAAFAFTTQSPCDQYPTAPRWYLDGGVEKLVGTTNYECITSEDECTFIKVNGQKLVCETGTFHKK